jgi:kojibiose phosphorylase
MESYFQKYLSDVEWLVQENTFDKDSQQVNESIFTLGNGLIGTRGIYEERPVKCLPGTFFAGIFDEVASNVDELINAPNFFRISIFTSRIEKLTISAIKHEIHKRVLDLKKGLLYRHTLFKNPNNHLFDYESIRFVSSHNLNIAVIQVAISPLDTNAHFSIDCSIDTATKNHGVIYEFDKRDYDIFSAERFGDVYYLSVESLDHKKEIGYAQSICISVDGKTKIIPHNFMQLDLNKGQSAVITKIISFAAARNPSARLALKGKVITCLQEAIQKGPTQLFDDHIKTFEKRWEHIDIKISGDTEAQSALRLNLYHHLIVADNRNLDSSIGAKLLSGEGYKGHVFWEAEMLLLPCYLFSQPEFARQLLEYRFNRLGSAKALAESRGYKGALYPWECAEKGGDETPHWTQDLDMTIKIVHTGGQSLHINVAIFYAIHLYFYATKDIHFMFEMGLEMIIEMARFWKSRVVRNKKQDVYKIKLVMGPDEFHDHTNNNAYTNKLVAWSFEKTLEIIDLLVKDHPDEMHSVLKKLKFYGKEQNKIKHISEKMYFPTTDSIIVQFDNFLKLKYHRLPPLNVFGLPELPRDILVVDYYRTQFVKQPDVILLLLLLPNYFDQKVAEANFHFYDSRTLHRSSWSPPIHSAMAAQLSFLSKASHYFSISVNTDKKDIFNNTSGGMHAPSVGGSWIAMIYGFCGIRILEGKLLITPNLPDNWQSVSIKFHYLEFIVDLNIKQKEFIIYYKKRDCPWLTNQDLRKSHPFICLQAGKTTMQIMPNSEYVIPYEPISCFEATAPQAVNS